MAFTLSSPAFGAGGDIPTTFTCDGDDISPHVIWNDAPQYTESFVLIMDDPDASSFTHWLVFDIPAECHDVPSGSRADAVGLSGRNSGTVGYIGPCPPSGTHLYIF